MWWAHLRRASNPDMGMPDMGMPDMGMPDMGMPDMGLPDMGMPDMGMPDVGMPDMGLPDMGLPDMGLPDMGLPDMGIPDMGMPDMGMPDMGMPDMGLPDMGLPDMGMPDMGLPDMGMPDMGLPDMGMPDMGMPDMGMPAARLEPQHGVQYLHGGSPFHPYPYPTSADPTMTHPPTLHSNLIRQVGFASTYDHVDDPEICRWTTPHFFMLTADELRTQVWHSPTSAFQFHSIRCASFHCNSALHSPLHTLGALTKATFC
jgi:hypothetical protein